MKKILSLTVLALIFGLSACNHDDEDVQTSDLSKTEATAKISSFNATAKQDLQDLSSAKGFEALTSLSDLASLDDPFGGRTTTDKKKLKTFLRTKGQAFQKIINKSYYTSGRSKEGGFDFAANAGIYTWNADLEEFEKTATSDIIKIQYPSEGSTTNNAELRLNAYEEQEFYDEEFGEYYYEPTSIDAELLVDAAKVASLQFSATWDPSETPLTADITAMVTPFTATASFDVTSSTKNTLSASLKRDSQTIFSTSVEVLYSGTEKSDEDIKTVTGFVQLIDLKIEGGINVEGIDQAQGEVVDLNEFVSLKVTTDGKNVGKIVFKTETDSNGDESSIAYIEYSDGSQEKLEDVLKPIQDELDSIDDDING
jgi:hypothetical protein